MELHPKMFRVQTRSERLTPRWALGGQTPGGACQGGSNAALRPAHLWSAVVTTVGVVSYPPALSPFVSQMGIILMAQGADPAFFFVLVLAEVKPDASLVDRGEGSGQGGRGA